MPTFFAFPALVFIIALPAFIIAEYRAGWRLIFPLKLVCSLCFVLTGWLASRPAAGGALPLYHGLMLAGLGFSLVGDLALVWAAQRKFFLGGLAAFLVAQVLYTTAFSLANGFSAWDLLVYLALLSIPLAGYRTLDLDLGRMRIPVIAYVLVITAMMAKATSTLYLGGIPAPAAGMVVSGAALFFASDAILALHKFQRRPANWYRAANLVTYYLGQMLLAGSLYFI